MGQGMRAPKAPLLAQEGSTTAGSAGWLSWLSTGCTREASAGAKRRPRWGVRERSRRPLLRYFSQPGIGSRGSYSSNSTTSPTFPRVLVVTDLLSQDVPLEDVQYLAGHANPRTTQIYDRRRRRVTRNIVERISV